MYTATLRLFTAIQVDTKDKYTMPSSLLERPIKHGYILDPAIKPDDALLDAIEDIVGLSGEKANATFHKSWSVIQDASMELLILQQIIHYVTTYGFESRGIYREDAVYIPCEVLELPTLQQDIPLVVIKAMDAQEILDRIVKLGSGIALAQETLNDLMTIIKANAYDSAFVHDIKNRELKALLYDLYGLVPSEPVEFLRHLVSKLTDESLLIKNDALIEKIKLSNGKFLDVLLQDAPDDLASIFFRFKPLFLAMKSISREKTFFNRLRKKAKTLHRPLPEDYLNSVTAHIKHEAFDLTTLEQRLSTATVFRKIRLAYALNHRLHAGRSIVYRVRNGRGWATEFTWPNTVGGMTHQALEVVLASIIRNLQPNVQGKMFYIPPYMHYALPATEKQFTGYLPTGSSVSVPNDVIVGIHWMNTEKRVDLDLSVIGESGKIGWDAAYRSDDRHVLFSGDMTDAPAPNGASELFYFKEGTQEAKILLVNYYNFEKGDEVGGKILVAHETPQHFGKNYMVDPNKILASANICITKRQNILGLIATVRGETRIYFANISIGTSITATHNQHATYARKYFVNSLTNTLDLRAMLQRAEATVVDERPDGDYQDLSPEALDKTTIIDLMK